PHSALVLSFHPTLPTDISTLSLHDALPISVIARKAELVIETTFVFSRNRRIAHGFSVAICASKFERTSSALTLSRKMIGSAVTRDRKSTRLNSSHDQISYAVFCLKKKNKKK